MAAAQPNRSEAKKDSESMLDSKKALQKRQREMLIQSEEVKQGTSKVDYNLDLGDDNAQNG